MMIALALARMTVHGIIEFVLVHLHDCLLEAEHRTHVTVRKI